MSGDYAVLTENSRPPRGSATLSSVDLTAVAAFVAAALSFVSVVIGVVLTFRLTSRGQLEQWQREQERPIVARILTISSDMLSIWSEVEGAKQGWAEDRKRREAESAAVYERFKTAAFKLWDDLRFEAAQLDLLAGIEVRKTASELIGAHDSIRVRLSPAGPGVTAFRPGEENKVYTLHQRLIEQARADLGLGQSALPEGARSPHLP